ncbi:MAG TPA: sulfotransferase [Gemmataceae bacterium]|nr:sulfotransferase [Gemmataceae bacterium]
MPDPPLDPQLTDFYSAKREAQTAGALAVRGQLEEACEHFRRAIEIQPHNSQFYFRLATCEWRLDRPEAGPHLRRAVELDPGSVLVLAALASWSLQNGQIAQADEASRKAMAMAPDDDAVLQARAAVLEALGDLDAAWELVDRLIRRGFRAMPVIRLYGRMAKYRDRQRPALEIIERQFADGGLAAEDRARLHFTAGDLLDSLGRYDEAFAHIRRGNELARPPYDPAGTERTIDSFIDFFTRDGLASLPKGSDQSNKPVFIVGMPRSGTTLVEQILSSHPAVHGGGETQRMSQVCLDAMQILPARPEDYPACLSRLTTEQVDRLARSYLDPLSASAPDAARITDKLPLNFLHLGLIAMLLPGARVIDCRRDPRDTCLSCYFAMFEAGNDFKYDLGHCAHFYQQYRRLMQHWHESLDLPILEVPYEEVVADPEAQTRRMLDFLGVAWDERCLRFFESKRPVTTSSVQQVRRPLYQSSVGRWRHYRRHLGELDRWFGEPPA